MQQSRNQPPYLQKQLDSERQKFEDNLRFIFNSWNRGQNSSLKSVNYNTNQKKIEDMNRHFRVSKHQIAELKHSNSLGFQPIKLFLVIKYTPHVCDHLIIYETKYHWRILKLCNKEETNKMNFSFEGSRLRNAWWVFRNLLSPSFANIMQESSSDIYTNFVFSDCN